MAIRQCTVSLLVETKYLQAEAQIDQAIVFISHLESPEIFSHFRRLKDESKFLLDSYFCLHRPSGHQHLKDSNADFQVSALDEERCLPRRYADKIRNGGATIPGFTDLTYMPILLGEKLQKYSFIWVMEYDVDFAGSWHLLFSQLSDSRADLMGTSFYPRADCLDWVWWKSLKTPSSVLATDFFRSFLPIARFSRNMIYNFAEAVEGEQWSGHTEALYPTIAKHNNLSIEDLGGTGPFTPTLLRGKNYFNTSSQDGHLKPGSFAPSPGTHSFYFQQSPKEFSMLGYLYHPVKVEGRPV